MGSPWASASIADTRPVTAAGVLETGGLHGSTSETVTYIGSKKLCMFY